MFDHTWYVNYLGLLIWHFTFPYLKELDNPPVWTFQRPFLFTDHLLNCWTKVIPAPIPGNLAVYFFQKENVHLSLPFIFYFGNNFLCVTNHFLQFQSDTIFFFFFFLAMAFDAKHCSHVWKVKIDYIFGLSFIHSHEYISFQENTWCSQLFFSPV